jgi:DNA-binding protein HU-beta
MSSNKLNKAQLVQALAEAASVDKKVAGALLDALNAVVAQQLSKDGPGEVTIPDLIKFTSVEKPGVPERQGRHPKTGEPLTIKAKAPWRAIKAAPVKALKDSVAKG